MVEEYSLNSKKKKKKKTNKISEGGGGGGRWRFYVMAGSKSSLMIDSPLTCMQSTETTFPEMFPVRIPRIG